MRVKIKHRIERMGMTVADVADLTGVKRQYLYRVISGNTTPSVKYVLKLCTVLKCIVEDLFELELKDTYKFLVVILLSLSLSIGQLTKNQTYQSKNFVSDNLYYVNSILASLKRRLRLSINRLVESFKLCKPYQRRSLCLNQR